MWICVYYRIIKNQIFELLFDWLWYCSDAEARSLRHPSKFGSTPDTERCRRLAQAYRNSSLSFPLHVCICRMAGGGLEVAHSRPSGLHDAASLVTWQTQRDLSDPNGRVKTQVPIKGSGMSMMGWTDSALAEEACSSWIPIIFRAHGDSWHSWSF